MWIFGCSFNDRFPAIIIHLLLFYLVRNIGINVYGNHKQNPLEKFYGNEYFLFTIAVCRLMIMVVMEIALTNLTPFKVLVI